MAEKYTPPINNYLLSIPEKPFELWRNELQLLYNSMKQTIADPLTIDLQWYDVNDEFSDFRDNDFNLSKSEVIVGVRKIVFDSVLPRFLGYHVRFSILLEKLSPQSKTTGKTRINTAREIIYNHKSLIELIEKCKERDLDDNLEGILSELPEEFGIRRIINDKILHYRHYLDFFRYPRSKGLPAKEYSPALGDYYIMKSHLDCLKGEELNFIPDDEQFNIHTYPGSLGSYKGRIFFALDILEKIDLVKSREQLMINLL